MPVANRTVISFGIATIPIAMYTAIQDNDIRFNQLHKEDKERIRYKKVCSHCNKEIRSEDIIKGYQYDKEHYVIVSDEDIEKIKTEKDKTIQILHSANLNQISPIYYNKAYHVLPETGGEKAFELLRRTLMEEQKIAIGKTVMGNHETLLAIIPREDGLIIQTMHFEDEVKEIPKSYEKKEVSEQELAMAKTLISYMDVPFDPAAYQDEYQVRLKKLIEDKIAGKEITSPEEARKDNVIDLMDSLKISVELAKSRKKASGG